MAKSSDSTHALKWQSLADYAFGSPEATTQEATDDSAKVATTAFVQDVIGLLKGTVGGAYDTLQEIQAALETNAGDIAGALADIASKDNKTEFSDFADDATLTLATETEYRATEALETLTLTLPTPPTDVEHDLPLKYPFMCTIDFSSHATTATAIEWSVDPSIYSTGDDCTDGLFIPIANKHYTWVIWYAGGKYQGVVRRSA